MAAQEPIYRHLTDDGLVGDGSNHIANVNGSVTPVPFWIGPPADEMWAIYRMVVTIEDNANITADSYGGISELTNGVSLKIIEGNQTTGKVLVDLMDGDNVKNVVGWAEHTYDMAEHSFGSGNNFVVARWTFAHAGRPLILDGADLDKLVVYINDDLTTLVHHEFQVQGHRIDGIGSHLNTW